MNEFTEQFLIEARELTEQASADLMLLEERPRDNDVLEKIFRAFHTLKGAAGIMEYTPMERMLHSAEDALQGVRSGARNVTPHLIDGLLGCVGQLVKWFDVIVRTGDMPAQADGDSDRAVAALNAGPTSGLSVPMDQDAGGAIAAGGQTLVRYRPSLDAFFQGEDPLARIARVPGLIDVRISSARPWPPLGDLQPFDCNLVIDAVSTQEAPAVAEAMKGAVGEVSISTIGGRQTGGLSEAARSILGEQIRFLQEPVDDASKRGRIGCAGRAAANVFTVAGMDKERLDAAVRVNDSAGLIRAIEAALGSEANAVPEPAGRIASETTIRVEVERIDQIVNLTGELMVAKNAIGHWARQAAEGGDLKALAAGLKAQHDVLERHVTDLQRSVFDLRVLPLERVFNRFPRLVRETASSLGKQVTLSTEGADTKADKAVVEALFEPLLHIIRNSIDHGIETRDQRLAAGKPETASLVLIAAREGDEVGVDIVDDGRGIDPHAIRQAAVARGVGSEAEIAGMTDDEAITLIFSAGFSTAQTVTGLSGRGVGMSAVRSAIERLGGEVSLLNRPGQGLTVRLTLPFTIMLTRVMTVHAGGQTFGIPFDAIVETVRAPRSAVRPLGAGRAFVLRDRTIPIVSLAESLGLDATADQEGPDLCLMVVWAGGMTAGLQIDRPGERLEMMLKPVEGILSGMPAVAGTSLLGDGRVLIVLDLKALLA